MFEVWDSRRYLVVFMGPALSLIFHKSLFPVIFPFKPFSLSSLVVAV